MSTIVLVGNPNVGKSAVFGALTGAYAEISNFPGTTVEVLKGRFGAHSVVDTPGIYGLSGFNDEERVTRSVLPGADLVVNVVDSVNLARDLFLTLQLKSCGFRPVVFLNLTDELKARGLKLDARGLSLRLELPVIQGAALKGLGIKELGERIETAVVQKGDDPRGVRPPPVLFGLAALDSEEEDHFRALRREADRIASEVLDGRGHRRRLSWWLGRASINPWTGLPILGGVLWAVYYFLGDLVAQRLVDYTEKTLMEGYVVPFLTAVLLPLTGDDGLIYHLLIGPYGLATMAAAYLFGLLLPLVAAFNLVMALLEDSGYLPRVAVLSDRILSWVGLNGKAIIPLILGFGCVTMATMTTRILGSRRERFIANFLLSLTVPCSAQLGVMAAMLGPLGGRYVLAWGIGLLAVFLAAGRFLESVIPGRSTPLLADLPPLRLPRTSNLLIKAYRRSRWFLIEAGPLMTYASLGVALVNYLGWLSRLEGYLGPLFEGWLRLPAGAAPAFLVGMLRRDFGAAGLYGLALEPGQKLVAVFTMTLFVPCLASTIMVVKERGRMEGVLIWTAVMAVAFALGGVAARLAHLAGL